MEPRGFRRLCHPALQAHQAAPEAADPGLPLASALVLFFGSLLSSPEMTRTVAAFSILLGIGAEAFGRWPLGIGGAALDAAFFNSSISAFCLDVSSFYFMLSWANTSVRIIASAAA